MNFRYLIYKNINERDFQALYKRISELQEHFDRYLNCHHFKISQSFGSNEVLGLDYSIQEGNYHGNIGFLFNDDPGVFTFNFYLAKALDLDNKSYYKKYMIAENVSLEFIERMHISLLTKALNIYAKLEDEDLMN